MKKFKILSGTAVFLVFVFCSSAYAAPSLTAKLVDQEKKAANHEATVIVDVKGIDLIDPATVNEIAHDGQGHLHYRVDDGPVIATTAKKLSFHELKSGDHKIVVMLAANDHQPLGPQQELDLKVA